ncbi:MAG: hypothetical protein ACT4OK_06815 [Gemmobacter sp.]
MRKVLVFALSIVAAIAAFVAARLVGIFFWDMSPNSLVSEVILNFASGCAMAFACFGVAEHFLPSKGDEASDGARVGLSSFVSLATIFILLAALMAALSIWGELQPSILEIASSVALLVGFFGFGLYWRKS